MAKKKDIVIVPKESNLKSLLEKSAEKDIASGAMYDPLKIDAMGTKGTPTSFQGISASYGDLEAGYYDKHKDYIGEDFLRGGRKDLNMLNQLRAENQSNWQQLGNMAGRIAVNIVPQIASGYASMLDLEGYVSAEHAANNKIVNWAMDLKKTVDEDWFPIYEENPGQSMSLSDPAWWMSRGGGLVESVGSFLAQGAGIGKGISFIGKGIGGLVKGKALYSALEAVPGITSGAKVVERVAKGSQGLASAVMLNQSEAVMESAQVFKDTYQAKKDSGFSIKDAKAAASEAAATTMNLNRINILMNLSSASAFLKPFTSARQLLKAPSLARAAGKTLFEGGQEATEELINHVASKAGMAKGRDEKYTLDNAMEDIGSMEGFEAAFLGALGGVAQTGGTKALEYSKYGIKSTKDAAGNRISFAQSQKDKYKTQQDVINELKEKGVKVTDILYNVKEKELFKQKLKKAEEEGDQATYDALQKDMFEMDALKHFQAGTAEVLEAALVEETKKDPAEVGEEYVNNANKSILALKELEKVYNNYEGYENVTDLYLNRANKLRNDVDIEASSALLKNSKLARDMAIREIAQKYEFKREQEVLYKKEGKVESTEVRETAAPLTYSASNIYNNTGDTEYNKKVYNDFLAEVEALPQFTTTAAYEAQYDTATKLGSDINKEYESLTSKEEQEKAKVKNALSTELKSAKEKLNKNTSITEIKAQQEKFKDEKFDKLAENRIAEIKKAKVVDNNTKKVNQIKTNFNTRIQNAKLEDLDTLREEVEALDKISDEDKDEIKESINVRAEEITNPAEVIVDEDGVPVERSPLSAFQQGSAEELEAQEALKHETEAIDTTIPEDIPDPKKEAQEVEEQVESIAAELLEDPTNSTLDTQGNVVYDYIRSKIGAIRAAFLSRIFSQNKIINTVSRSEITDEILNQQVLDPNSLLAGTKILLKIDVNYTGDKYDQDSDTKKTIKWSTREEALIEKHGEDKYRQSPEYLNEVPIVATDEEGNTLFYVHDTAWITAENVNNSEKGLEEDRERLRAIRQEVINQGTVETKIDFKGLGHLFKTADGKPIPVSDALPGKNVVFAVGKDGKPFYTNPQGGDIKIINKKGFQNGRLYALLPVGPTKDRQYIAVPLQRQKLISEEEVALKSKLTKDLANAKSPAMQAKLKKELDALQGDKIVNTIMRAVELYFEGDITNNTVKEISAATGLDITSLPQLKKFIKKFIYLTELEGKDALEVLLTSKNSKLDSGQGIIRITGNSIEFGRPTINGDGASKAIVLSKVFNETAQQRANKLIKLRSLLGTMLNSSDKDSLTLKGKAGKVVIINKDDSTTTQEYSDFVKTTHETNIMSINIGTEENPNWVYTIQPTITFDDSFVSKESKSKTTAVKKETKTPIKQSLNYKGVNPTVDLIVTKVVNGETQVLLIKRGDNVAAEAGKLAFPGGFHDTDAKKGSAWKAGKETAEEAAIRELKEETGLDLNKSNMGITLEKVGTFDDKGRDPRNSEDSWVSATVFRVNLPENFDVSTEVSGQDDAKDAQWIPVSILNSSDISRFGFDHAAILESEGIAFPVTYPRMTEEEIAAEEQVEEIAEEIISFNIGGESFQFSNKDDDADSELDEFLNEEEDEDEDFLPPTATPEQIKNFSDRASEQLVKGLDLRGQSALINYLASRISTEALKKGGTVDSKEVFAAEGTKLNKLIDTLEAKGLENKAKRIKVILKQWQKVAFLTNQHLSLFSTGTIMNAKDDSVENGLERTHYNDDWTFTVSSKNTASAELKKFFSFIQDVDAEGNLVYNPLLGLPEVVPFDEVYDTLHEVLANRPSDFNTMLQYIELYQNRYPWFSSVAKQLKAAPDNIKNQFVTDMTKHHIQMNFIMWSKDGNGNYQLQNWSSNSSSIEQRLKDSWDSNLRSLGGSNLITTNENNEYVFDGKTIDALTAQAEEWATNPPSADEAGFMEVAQWLGNFGIVLTDNTYEDLAAGKYKNKMLLSWKELFTNSNSFIDVLSKQLNKNKTILVDDAAILNDSAVKALAVLEARNTANVFSNSFNAGTKTIYSYSNNNYLVNRVRDLTAVDDDGAFTNPELIDALNKIPFTSASQWLADLQKDTAAGRLLRDTLKVGYVSLEALKKQYTPSKDNRKLNQLTTIEHEVVKLGMFFNASKNIIDGENRRIVNFFYPTMSDKSTMLTMQTLSRQFDLGDDGSLSDDNLELLYNAMVLPELKRMASDKANNVSGYQPDYFYFMPALNEAVITINDQEYNLRDYVLDGKVFENADAKKEILVILKDTYNEIVAQKLEDWEKLGIGKTDSTTNEKFALLDKSYMATAQGLGQDKVTYAAQDYVFNSLIANAEMFMLFAGDPALYSKFKSDKTIQENLEESFINLGKRLAGDIAPGMELANSATNSYYQVFFNDKKLNSSNVTNKAVSEYFTKIMSDFRANYSGIEGSDAQEYTTWQEHIYVLNKLGRLTNKQYKDIKSKLTKGEELSYKELGFVLQPLKPVYVGNLADVDNHVDRRVYIKSSSFPLLPQLTATLEIDKIRVALEEFQQKKNDAGEKTLAGDPITVRASFNTANKVGGVSKSTDVFDNNGDVIDDLVIDDANALLLERANFRIQQDVPYDREKHEVNIGTQARKLLFVNMLDVEIEPGVTGEQLQKEYNDLYENLFKYRHEQLLNKLGLVKTTFTEEPVTFFDVNKEDTIFGKLKERDAKLAEVKSTLTSRAIRSEYEEKLGDAEIKKAEFINNNFDLIVEQLLAAKVNVFFEEEFKKTKDCK
jgi:ADP-ribose pyrophosphatase YjhB (NUDIX family)